jgi:hydroxypyruvate isomerase
MLFVPEADTIADRIHLAAGAGFTAVEFWDWRDKDLDAIERALDETGMKLVGLVSTPMAPLTDPTQHDRFLDGLVESMEVAQQLRAGTLIAQAGDEVPGVPRDEQHASIRSALLEAADLLEGSGVTLALEPLNTRVDHPGYYLHSTSEGLDLIEAVDRPEIRLLYDLYHSYVMDEGFDAITPGGTALLRDRVHLIAHVHLADAPGRHEPGSGEMDWRRRLEWLESHGYDGYVGLEYSPTGGTLESLRELERS